MIKQITFIQDIVKAKEEVRFLKRNILTFIIIVSCFFTLTACTKKENNIKKTEEKADSIKFKEDYEKLNGTTNNNKTIRTIEIPSDNPFKYKNADEIVQAIDNKESFVVYFGFNSCPWCRSVVPTLIEVAKDLKIDSIYYVDVKEIRDVLELDDDNNVITKTKGSDGYYKLLTSLDSVLADYELTAENGDKIKTKEKRIFAPNIIAIVDGKPVKLTSGISSKQNDAYMELSDEMKDDMYKNINEVLELVINSKNSCNVNSAC